MGGRIDRLGADLSHHHQLQQEARLAVPNGRVTIWQTIQLRFYGYTDLFSKRQMREHGEIPDVYQYNKVPRTLRVQILHIVNDAVGVNRSGYSTAVEAVHSRIERILLREYGLMRLSQRNVTSQAAIAEFFIEADSASKALDIIELYFQAITTVVASSPHRNNTLGHALEPTDAVEDLNVRFLESGLGYQFESGHLIRLDSDYLHAEAVKPTLAVLRGARFSGANEEFLVAHEHYRNGRTKECLVDCLKAFESTMKSICASHNWTFNHNDNAKTMIATCIAHGLIPSYLESKMSAVRSLLESGVPTVRNRNGAHGQGAEPVAVPDYLARYALNLTATTILFLVEVDGEAG